MARVDNIMTNIFSTSQSPAILEFYTQFDIDLAQSSGLVVAVVSGNVQNPAGAVVQTPSTSLTLVDNSVNYVYVDAATETVLASVSSTTAHAGTVLYTLTTNGGNIVSCIDARVSYLPTRTDYATLNALNVETKNGDQLVISLDDSKLRFGTWSDPAKLSGALYTLVGEPITVSYTHLTLPTTERV